MRSARVVERLVACQRVAARRAARGHARGRPTMPRSLPRSTFAEYAPGQFYLRELPCLLAVIDRLDALPRTIVVDGYVFLGPERPGLGAHLYDALAGNVPVVGVAKRPFRDAFAVPVRRGESARPLYVTAIGLAVGEAAAHVRAMHGEHRIPTLLRRVDALSRHSDG